MSNILQILLFSFMSMAFLNGQSLEEEKALLRGSFAGEWSTFKKDINGDITHLTSWQDTLVYGKMTVEDSILHVRVEVSYTFGNKAIPSTSMTYLEGLYFEEDSITGRFFSTGGHIIPYVQVSENTFAYTEAMHPNEFPQFRFMSAVEGSHTLIKEIVFENNREVHHFTRVTTIISMDNKGNEKSRQFVSLKGTRWRLE